MPPWARDEAKDERVGRLGEDFGRCCKSADLSVHSLKALLGHMYSLGAGCSVSKMSRSEYMHTALQP